MTIAELRARQQAKNKSGKGKAKQPNISSSDVSDTTDMKADTIMFESACKVAKNQPGACEVSDFVYLSNAEVTKLKNSLRVTGKGNGVEKEGITIVIAGETIKYLKV